jgi:hypothetical protein
MNDVVIVGGEEDESAMDTFSDALPAAATPHANGPAAMATSTEATAPSHGTDAAVLQTGPPLDNDVIAHVEAAFSLDAIRQYMEQRCRDCDYDDTVLRACPKFIAVLNHLHYSLKKQHLDVWDKKKIVLCSTFGVPDCLYFCFRAVLKPGVHCEPCSKKHSSMRHREGHRKRALAKGIVDRSSIHSKCPINNLTEDEVRTRLRESSAEMEKARTKIRSLEKKLEGYQGQPKRQNARDKREHFTDDDEAPGFDPQIFDPAAISAPGRPNGLEAAGFGGWQHTASGFAPFGYGLPGYATLGLGIAAWSWPPVRVEAASVPLSSPVADATGLGVLPVPATAAAVAVQPMQGAGSQQTTEPVGQGHGRLGSPVVAAPGKPDDAPLDVLVANAVVFALGNAAPTVEQGTNAQAAVAQRVNERAAADVHGQDNPAPSAGLQPNGTLGMYGEYMEACGGTSKA